MKRVACRICDRWPEPGEKLDGGRCPACVRRERRAKVVRRFRHRRAKWLLDRGPNPSRNKPRRKPKDEDR